MGKAKEIGTGRPDYLIQKIARFASDVDYRERLSSDIHLALGVCEAKISTAQSRASHAVAASQFIDGIASSRRESIRQTFESLINEAIAFVYEQSIRIALEWSFKRNRPSLTFVINRILSDGSIVSRDLDRTGSGAGGGLYDLISVVMRILFVELRSGCTAKFMVLDEPFRHQGAIAERGSEFLKIMADRFGWQFLVITHDEGIASMADSCWSVVHDGQKSIAKPEKQHHNDGSIISRIELRGFESHSKTFLNLSPGLNVIVGSSNSGKTSIIRAICSILEADWHPSQISSAHDECSVSLLGQRGLVTLDRGKRVRWTISQNGRQKKYSGTGKVVPDEVYASLTIYPVRVGSTKIMLNVQNQFDPHFLISEIAGEKSTPSTAAKLIDCLAGLDGIDEIVDSIALIKYVAQQDAKKIETEADNLKLKLPDAAKLDHDKALLEQAKKSELDFLALQKQLDHFQLLALDIVPLNLAKASFDLELAAMPDFEKVEKILPDLKKSADMLSLLRMLHGWILSFKNRERELKSSLPSDSEIADCLSLLKDIEVASGILPFLSSIRLMQESLLHKFSAAEEDEENLRHEHDSMMRTFKICPLCYQPITEPDHAQSTCSH